MMYAIVVLPALTFLIEFLLNVVLHPIIQGTRFEESNRFWGVSFVAALILTVYVSGLLNELVLHDAGEDEQ